jgi:hypothetical protein
MKKIRNSLVSRRGGFTTAVVNNATGPLHQDGGEVFTTAVVNKPWEIKLTTAMENYLMMNAHVLYKQAFKRQRIEKMESSLVSRRGGIYHRCGK